MAPETVVLLFVLIVNTWDYSFGTTSILCEEDFCKDYEVDTGCSSTHQHCRINNATHTGLTLPSPTECNCCHFCMPFYLEGEQCSLGGSGVGTTIGRCGHGLSCQAEAGGNFCRRMNTECHRAQDDFDSRHAAGNTGALEQRPLCDNKGKFEAYDCIPSQTCFCQSPEGERLFGEFQYLGATSLQEKHCGCSLTHYQFTKFLSDITGHVPTPRCTPDGNYNPVQCVGKICYCVDKETGDIQNDESIDLEKKPVRELSCYDAADDIYPNQNQGDKDFSYTTPCLQSIDERLELIQSSKEDGYNVDYYADMPECLPDGSFGRMAMLNGTQVCVNHRNRRIGTYAAVPGTDEYNNMDCKCALTSSIMTLTNELPSCCKNGNFRPLQCRRGVCRCVDSDGKQIGQETTDMTQLSCYNPNSLDC